MDNIKGIALPGGKDAIIDCEFTDDINLYLEDTRENLANVKFVLNILAMAEGARINWHNSNAIWASDQPRGWTRELMST
jgi:hypothetical protein